MNDLIQGGAITYSFREVLDRIDEKLARNGAVMEQFDKRMSTVETRVQQHDKILTEQMPRFQKTLDELNVQKQVEAALDSRKVKGVSNRDRVVVGSLSGCILVVSLLSYLPHVVS